MVIRFSNFFILLMQTLYIFTVSFEFIIPTTPIIIVYYKTGKFKRTDLRILNWNFYIFIYCLYVYGRTSSKFSAKNFHVAFSLKLFTIVAI